MSMAPLVLTEDVAIAVSGAFNAGYFARYLLRRYWLRASERRARRTGAAALTLLGFATVAEALFSQWLLWEHGDVLAPGEFSVGIWTLARLPLLLATGFITAIVLRRIFS